MKKALILYAGIGGFGMNIDWTNWEVHAFENDPEIAKEYKNNFPNHRVFTTGGEVIKVGGGFNILYTDPTLCRANGDAHAFLEEHAEEYDFIQSSPPCQTHSRLRYALGVCSGVIKHKYPCSILWDEIIFLATHPTLKKDCKWIVENVNPYYNYLVRFAPQYMMKIGRHFIWTNANPTFFNPADAPVQKSFSTKSNQGRIMQLSLKRMYEQTGIKIENKAIKNKRQVLRNMFEPELGKFVFEAMDLK